MTAAAFTMLWNAWFVKLCLATLLFRCIPATGNQAATTPAEACVEFETGDFAVPSWKLADCIEVWTHFSSSFPVGLQRHFPKVDLWRETGSALRRVGVPCFVTPSHTRDGVGSTTMRHISAWILSKEMGCDWVKPNWGKLPLDGVNGTIMYCHGTATTKERKAPSTCYVVNWLKYFQLDVPSVDQPEGGNVNLVQLGLMAQEGLVGLQEVIQDLGSAKLSWDRVEFTFHPSFASQYLACQRYWDQPRRDMVRAVLREARQNFHRHPREWYDEKPECTYDEGRLNFAIHVRMGDRREFFDVKAEYYEMLELFMASVSEVVEESGLDPPVFHVFSETVSPCPPANTGLFDEFPIWPIAREQVPVCWAAETPQDCPEKEVGFPCNSKRSGTFDVVGKPIVLHVGKDVRNAMSCMIQADGVLMGCSTFGQIAGIFSRGISFFSMQCGGVATPDQYKIIPPLAVVEMGYLWVPIAGSWHDPVLKSTEIFRGALDSLITARQALPPP